MKQKTSVSIIGLLIAIIGIVSLVGSCSLSYKIKGVWEQTESIRYDEDGKEISKKEYPVDYSGGKRYEYYCFTKNNMGYYAYKIVGGSEATGLTRSADPFAYTVSGNSLIMDGKTTLVISGKTATITSEYKRPNGKMMKTVEKYKKVSSPSVKDIETAKKNDN